MAIRQYIGARYVPRFLGTYDATQQYEVLDVVDNGLGTSYILKKPAPVGTPVSNTTYWALYGTSNGAIINLQNQINDINNTTIPAVYDVISDMKNAEMLRNKKIVAYGDSSVYVGGGASSYLDYVCEAVDATLTNRAIPGTNMTTTTDNGLSLINASTDLGTFDVCFLGYGINEFSNSRNKTDVQSDISALINAVRAKSSTITIIFCLPYYVWHYTFPEKNQRGITMGQYNEWCKERLNRYGVPYIDFYKNTGCNVATYTKYLADDGGGNVRVHPTEEYKKELAACVLNGFESYNYIGDTIFGMVDPIDFATQRLRIDNADINTVNGCYNGFIMKLNANEIVVSTDKLIQTGRYMLKGKTTNPITVAISDQTLSLSGEFEEDLWISTTVTNITITCGNTAAIVSDFDLYKYTNLNSFTKNRFTGRIAVPTLVNSYATTPSSLQISNCNGNLMLHSFSLNVTDKDSIAANDTLFTLNGNIDLGTRTETWIGHRTNGTELTILSVSGNEIKFAIAPVANGNYFFEPLLFAPFKTYY